ncbi:hypothetical protein GGR52DRAFT_581870 [Hypoxylon sp. FL1284]|nr:hypothetical protein GGR52DRAFT_581870 [Hypoxylon sp. FL1284]
MAALAPLARSGSASKVNSRRHRHPSLRISPSRILALRLRSKTDRQKQAYRRTFVFGARQRADRLPLTLLHIWLARQDIRNEPDLAASMRSITPSEWADRFHSLASKGWSTEDVGQWIWILSGEDGDTRVQRLVSTETPKPIFLTMLLARCDERFRKAESLLSLMDYASKHYFHPRDLPSSNDIALHGREAALTVSQFLILLRRLVSHVQRIWPRSIVTVARFTADYIQRMPSEDCDASYDRKCKIFNAALQSFKRPATTRPRLLLAMSDNLDKPLIINKASYLAVREVMVGLKKSQAERAVARRYAKSWPPRTTEDDYSRSVKAGILAKEAGYPDDDYDQALGVLGGMGTDSPTVQTRSLPPREWKGEAKDRNIYSHWAMMIRATRNHREAWKTPNIQVYAEMFVKLQARPNFPIHEANYTEYELARLSPPTTDELYEQMVSRGVKPEGYCLRTLLINAQTLGDGIRYLRDSGLDAASVNVLALFKQPSYQALRKIPLLQPNHQSRRKIPPTDLLHIRHAIKLASVRLKPGGVEGVTFRSAWTVILRALARPYICALAISMEVLELLEESAGIDPDAFMYVCQSQSGQTVAKRLKSIFSQMSRQITTTPGSEPDSLPAPGFMHIIGPAHLHTYMRTLGFLGDYGAMKELLQWMLTHREHVDEEAERIAPRGHALVAKTLCAFEAFAGPDLGLDEHAGLVAQMESGAEAAGRWRWPTPKEVENYIPQSTLTQPRSLYQGFVPPAPECREQDAVSALLQVAKSQQPLQDFTEFILDDFAVYFKSDIYPYELKPLQHLATRLSSDHFYFDGVLSCGDKRFYLKRVAFRQLPIGNYGDDEHTIGDQIWIRSKLNEERKNEIYYKLKSPSVEYARFYNPFLWIANLTKHALDYCDYLKEEGRRAVLYDFKSHFSTWLLQMHAESAAFTRWHAANGSSDFRTAITFIASIAPGDVLSTKPDDENTDTLWERAESIHHGGEHLWYGLVQKVHKFPRGKRYFDVIWLYQSIDTPCGVMKYPWHNELFLSNNCTCHHGTAKIQSDQVLATHNVEWFGSPSTTAEYFVRQTYLSDECRWTTMKKEHLVCAEEGSRSESPYKIGDAVLVETNPKALHLETFIVEGYFDEDKKNYVRLRKLTRRRDVDKNAPNSPPNEVIYTDRFFEIASRAIYRHCLVRAFQPGEEIPTPYNYAGTGDAFFMTHQEVLLQSGKSSFVPLDMSLVSNLRQGFDPAELHQSPTLRGLDLYCGGGNFGRGLEDGGAIAMRWANDIWREAIHTYMANSEPGACTPFLGSVDELLLRAIKGDDDAVPQPGDVQFISGGSPCPGFSPLTKDKTTEDQRKNQSLIASFASFVDLYRPHYGVLENVPQMVNTKRQRAACVFSQLACALVGAGYQAQVMFLDAWAFGAPQARSRVFLCFSAPGFRMPRPPPASHSHPPGTRLTKLGEMSCGRPFDSRRLAPTPFRFVGAAAATRDLPDVADAKPDFCVGFPDHRLSMGLTPPVRRQLFPVPTQPWGMSFSKAWHGRGPLLPPVMSASDRELYPPGPSERVRNGSKAWSRVHPNRLFGTVATRCNPSDARLAAMMHWHQHRPLTIMEGRRAQGFPDNDVLVGGTLAQWRLIGNSVARQVSVALGLAFREAWFGTLFDEPHLTRLAFPGEDEVPDARVSSSSDLFQAFLNDDDDLFAASSPPKTIPFPFTPATTTTDENPASDRDVDRKRLRPLYVEITTNKKPRLDVEVDEEREPSESFFVEAEEGQDRGLYE